MNADSLSGGLAPTPASVPRIGVFGGSFNPVHMGHLIMAQDALELFELSRILFVPCAQPPHKSTLLEPAEHRLAMLQAALEGELRFEASDIELRRGGISWSVETIREVRAAWPGAEITFIVGADSLLELHAWREVYTLLDLCRVVTLARPGVTVEALGRVDLKLEPPWPDRLRAQIRVGHLVNISSTDIRYRIAEGMSIRYLVHPAVEMYIAEHRLYRK
jgi:nicotinate-nucleotide adenylyltransferase